MPLCSRMICKQSKISHSFYLLSRRNYTPECLVLTSPISKLSTYNKNTDRSFSNLSHNMSSSLKRKNGPFSSSPDPKKPMKDASLTSFFGAPKIVSSTTSSSTKNATGADSSSNSLEGGATKFDKEKWAASLSAEEKKLLKLEIDTLDPSWLAHLKDEITSKEFLDLKRFLQEEIDSGKKIFPPLEDVYSWSRHTPLNTVKAVILGQDPYHNHNQAHGLCFSVRPPTPAPPSLKNMYIALKNDYPDFKSPPNNGGLLTPWAEQGVLMLNTCLTVRAHEANSHSNHGWEKFTQKVIDTVVKVRGRGVVFLAWGTPAQKRCVKITGGKHLVLKSVHPSPLSASRGFFDCGHFKKTNEWLGQRYGVEGVIDWNLNKSKPIKAPNDVKGPVKVTERQKTDSKQDGSVTERVENDSKTVGEKVENVLEKVVEKAVDVGVVNGKVGAKKAEDEFEGSDDEDAIEALEELARSSANGGDDVHSTQGTVA